MQTLERKLNAWNDPDREGAWRLFTLCRGCAEVKFCRGKERDRVVCRDCFLSEATIVPFFELGLWDYKDAAGAKREHARGLVVLEERKAEADARRRENLEEARKRRQATLEIRNEEIVRLVSEGNSYEYVAELFDLSPATIRRLAGGQSKWCPANPHGYAAKNTEMTGVMGAPSLPTVLDHNDTEKAHSEAALSKRRRTFEQRSERRQLDVEELAEMGVVASEIADRLGVSDRIVSSHLAVWKKKAA